MLWRNSGRLRTAPNFAEAHNSLGSALAKLPRPPGGAIAEFQAAPTIRPDYLQARTNVAAACALDSRGLRRSPGAAIDQTPVTVA